MRTVPQSAMCNIIAEEEPWCESSSHGLTITNQAGIGTVLDAGSVIGFSRPLEKSELALGHHGAIGPATTRQLFTKKAHLLTQTFDSAEDALAGEQNDVLRRVALDVGFDVPLRREPQMIVENLSSRTMGIHLSRASTVARNSQIVG